MWVGFTAALWVAEGSAGLVQVDTDCDYTCTQVSRRWRGRLREVCAGATRAPGNSCACWAGARSRLGGGSRTRRCRGKNVSYPQRVAIFGRLPTIRDAFVVVRVAAGRVTAASLCRCGCVSRARCPSFARLASKTSAFRGSHTLVIPTPPASGRPTSAAMTGRQSGGAAPPATSAGPSPTRQRARCGIPHTSARRSVAASWAAADGGQPGHGLRDRQGSWGQLRRLVRVSAQGRGWHWQQQASPKLRCCPALARKPGHVAGGRAACECQRQPLTADDAAQARLAVLREAVCAAIAAGAMRRGTSATSMGRLGTRSAVRASTPLAAILSPR